MPNQEDVTAAKKKHDTSDDSVDSNDASRKNDTEDPKPRIVLTFRSEKSGAKSSNMKIVSSEEKQEEISPRRSVRTRGSRYESDDDFEVALTSKKDKVMSENDESDSSLRRTTRGRGRERSDNVAKNAIARKEKSYNESVATHRPSRRIKPTAKVLENEELRMEFESQNIARLGINTEKSPEEGVRTRRGTRSKSRTKNETIVESTSEKSAKVISETTDSEVPVKCEKKLEHLEVLGLKAVVEEVEIRDSEDEEMKEVVENEEEEDEGDDEEEVISKLIEADVDDVDTADSSDDDVMLSEMNPNKRPRRSTRQQSSYEDCPSNAESPIYVDEEEKELQPKRRSSRKAKISDDDEEEQLPAPADEGMEATCPEESSTIIATCYCGTPSNVCVAPEDLIEPVFCQAIEMVDKIRVGCSHGASKDKDGTYSAMVRAGPRAPFFLACPQHTKQLRKHMCCPACGLFCSQGIFYQCSEGHFFHLDCGLPYNDSKTTQPGCPHCGVFSYRWQPVNKQCWKVHIQMKCTNKRIYLPEQRVQCTQAYIGFSSKTETEIEEQPVIPSDLLPPLDLKALFSKLSEQTLPESSPQALCDAILAAESVEQILPKILSAGNLNQPLASQAGGSCLHVAASVGNFAVACALHYAGASLDAVDDGSCTPLHRAVLALLDKSSKQIPKEAVKENSTEEMEVDGDKDTVIVKEEAESKTDNDDDLLKVIKYLVAAGCNVNLPGPDGMTALHLAAQHGGSEVCSVILRSAIALLDPRDHGGWTPLVWAAENKHTTTVRLLISLGADAAATDNEGNSAIHWCALAGDADSLRHILEAAPHVIDAANSHSDTPLHIAARQSHYACVVILLARGAKTDIENSSGELAEDVCSGQCQTAIALNTQMALASGKRCRLVSSDISKGREDIPIPCINELDDTVPEPFTYVTQHVMPTRVAIDNTIPTMQGCTCKDDACASSSCACCLLGVRVWFNRGRLLPSFPYREPPMLFECNQTCACNLRKCNNRAVSRLSEKGSMLVRAQVFRCKGGRGWGLRATLPVPQGSPVATYVGELLTMDDADTRGVDQYMFALDLKQDLLDQCAEKVQLCVDAASYGSAARFINHSCKPNLAPVRVFTHSRDLRLPCVALFATRDIKAGEEFTFDYGDKFWSVKSKWMQCECGVLECRYPNKVMAME